MASWSPSSSASLLEELSVVQVLDSNERLVSKSSSVPECVQVLDSSEPLVHSVGDVEPVPGHSTVGAAATSDEQESEHQYTGSSGRRVHLYAEEVSVQWNLRKIHRVFGTTESCITFAEEREMVSKMCPYHRSPMCLMKSGGQFGSFRCQTNCKSKSCSRTLGTWFEEARLPIAIIFELMYMFAYNYSYEDARRETVSEDREGVLSFRTIMDWYSYCREVVVVFELEKQEEKPMIGGSGKIVQIDESKFGRRKYNRVRHIEGHWIIGMIEDASDDLRLEVCPDNDRSANVLIPLIKKHVREGSIIHTDFWRAYNCLPEHGYIHKKVNHSDPVSRFVAADGTHTQRIESHWRGLKRKYSLCNFKGNFIDWVIENNWRRNNQINHYDLYESLLDCIKYVYKVN